MILSLVSIAIVLALAYAWLTRGFYSALINLICVLIAGAVAFGVHEVLAYQMLDKASSTNLFAGSAWAISLALPFAITLALLRALLDNVLLKANVKLDTVPNYIGGALCGAISGTITAGIVVLSIGFLRMDTDFLGHKPLEQDSRGNLKQSKGLLFPVDRLTGKFYGQLSKTAFRTETNLGTFYPDIQDVPGSLRMNFGEGKGRNTFAPGDFTVNFRYTVGEGLNARPGDLLTDRWNLGPQDVTDTTGKPYPQGSHLEGYFVTFKSSAKERDGKVVLGNAQMRLVVENEDGESMTLYPVALLSQADIPLQELGRVPIPPIYARFRFDNRDLFLASVGGGSESKFGMEFVVPPGYTPKALFVRNIRHAVDQPATAKPKEKFKTPAERDIAIGGFFGGFTAPVSGTIWGGSTAIFGSTGTSLAVEVDESDSVRIGTGRVEVNRPLPDGISVTNAVLNYTLHKTQLRSISIDDDTNVIIEGEQIFTQTELSGNVGIDRKLQVNKYTVDDTTVIMQVDVSLNKPQTLVSRATQKSDDSLPINLIDTNNKKYEPVGYQYRNATTGNVTIRYTPNQPIVAYRDLPSLSKSRPNDQLILIFRCTLQSQIKYLAIGDKAIAKFDPVIKLELRQGGR